MGYRVILSVKGQDPMFLGHYSLEEASYLAEQVQENEQLRDFVNIIEDTSYPRRKGYAANPAPRDYLKSMDKKGLEKLLLECLKKPYYALKTAPLHDEVSVGKDFTKKGEGMFPIRYKQVEKISLAEVAAHLGVFIPRCRSKMPLEILRMFEKGQRVIPQKVIDKYDFSAVITILLDNMFRNNTKLAKSKVPSSLGIGTPMGDGLSEAPVSGSLGLQFMPNITLLNTQSATGEKSFREIINSYAEDPILKVTSKSSSGNLKKYSTQIAVLLTKETLNPIKGKNACIGASPGCISACNVNSGGRFNTVFNIYGEITNDTDEMAGRMLLGFWQTAFIANPFYFLRLLIEAIYMNGVKHETSILEFNTSQKYLGNPKEMVNLDKYLDKLPLSIRLNTYSDYPWEMIYPDLFTLFNGKGRKGFGSYQPLKVQFYDYTKLSGRWTAKQRKAIWETLELEIPKRVQNSLHPEDRFALGGIDSYDLPENYHLTFSFNGKDKSKAESFLANLAGQNATFVFSSQQINNKILYEMIKNARVQVGGKVGEDLVECLETFSKVFKKTVNEIVKSRKVSVQRTSPLADALPLTYMGFDVISGDTYDLRFLDIEAQKQIQGRDTNLDPVIIGLVWKVPDNFKLTVGETNYSMTPFNASMLLDTLEEVQTDIRLGEGFAQTRVGTGFKYEEDGRGLVSLYFLAEEATLESTNRIIEQIVSLSEEQIVTFATETGKLINDGNSPEEISEHITTRLSEIVDSEI